jgi:hypothetical protein
MDWLKMDSRVFGRISSNPKIFTAKTPRSPREHREEEGRKIFETDYLF